MPRCRFLFTTALLLAAMFVLSACQDAPTPPPASYGMGDRVRLGNISYVVVSSQWRTQLGEGFQVRSPSNRFLVMNMSVTNGGGAPVSIPLLTLVDAQGNEYRELQDGTGLSNWMGLIRTVEPADTLQGRLLFDVPLTSYTLRIPDIEDETLERSASVEIPLDLQIDDVAAPLPTLDEIK